MNFNLFKKKAASSKILVLMYHRIAAVETDPWQLAVSPLHFEQQLRLLTKKFTVITVSELMEQVARKRITDNAVCLTFDDGYNDNFYQAQPLLGKYNCPATFFIPTQGIVQQKLFWWDELEALILTKDHLPASFSQALEGGEITANLKDESVLTEGIKRKQNGWYWPQKPPTKRCVLYLQLWERLKPLPNAGIQAALACIRQWAGVESLSLPACLPVTVKQLQEMSAYPLFDIGMHTASHPALSAHPSEVQRSEIVENKEVLQQLCPQFINSIAFPYGAYNNITLDVLRELDIAAAFSTKGTGVTNSSEGSHLGRFQVNNWESSLFEKKLTSWFKHA